MTYRLHYAPDNASLILRLALEQMGQPYETVLVDRRTNAHKSPGYMALNPNGFIPVLETPDGPMFETAAILLWLTDRHGQLAPAPDSPARAAFLKWLFCVSNTIHVALRMTFYPEQYVGANAKDQTQLRLHMRGPILRHFDNLEDLAGQGHDWFAAPVPAALDFYVACMMRWLALYPSCDQDWFDISRWPQLHDMLGRLEDCPSVSAAIYAEGLGPNPFTAPIHPTPPEGSAT
ncbi:glutathione S-transferase family protein [Roseovarius sp. 2305UL8-3]|uniref:glutathione S-transferase family protein n=1 Tax=Roseovarius conchicola TaxID=3121636 RepID=UPI00352715F4